MSQPQHINSAKPFVSTAQEYVNHGWSVIPLPERSKELKLTGVTGFHPVPDEKQIQLWIDNPDYAKANIALRLGNVVEIDGKNCEVIGIDVDHYGAKRGGDSLAKLESKHGMLPETWTSTARSDGISGIRFFLVPAGFRYRGQAGPDIEVIQRRHRYAAIFPSWNPSAKEQYNWYEPGVIPDGVSMADEMPYVTELAFMPEEWITYLTRGKTVDEGEKYDFDLNITAQKLELWADKALPVDDGTYKNTAGCCPAMLQKMKYWEEIFENCTTLHYNLVESLWNTILWAKEGHIGWRQACEFIEAEALAAAKRLNNRTLGDVRAEIRRAREGALRKIKGMIEYEIRTGDKLGLDLGIGICTCDNSPTADDGNDDGGNNWYDKVPRQVSDDPVNYPPNDLGMAKCFLDIFGGNIHYLTNTNQWALYDGENWIINDAGRIKELFSSSVIERFKRRAKQFFDAMDQHLLAGGNKSDDRYKQFYMKQKQLHKLSVDYGNATKCNGMLSFLQALTDLSTSERVSQRSERWDADPTLRLMPNGKVIRLTKRNKDVDQLGMDAFVIEDNKKENYLTLKLGANYIPLEELSKTAGWKKWQKTLRLFLPDEGYRKFVQMMLGHTFIGGNPHRLAIFLIGKTSTGKSTILNAMLSAYGDYADAFDPNKIFRDKELNPELGYALNRTMLGADEMGAQRLQSNAFKSVTGGTLKKVELKGLNQQITGIPQFVPITSTNAPPIIEGQDLAVQKRTVPLPFKTQVTSAVDDPGATVDIGKECRDAVLHWLLEGYEMYFRTGLEDREQWHPLVLMETIEFNSELSSIGEFIAEHCVLAQSDVMEKFGESHLNVWPKEWYAVTDDALYERYLMHCDQNRVKMPHSKNKLTSEMKGFGLEKWETSIKGKTVRYWKGLKLQPLVVHQRVGE